MTVVIVGEAMLEYRSQAAAEEGLHYGGDTLNTAIHLARAGLGVRYLTALGQDPLSEALVADWQREGLDTSLVLRHPSRQPGIYAIHVDRRGERSFLYWRGESAARDLFDLSGIEPALRAAADCDLLYFSNISLAVLPEYGRETLLTLASQVRANGGLVAYDSNYRPRLWPDSGAACEWSDRAIASANIGLPTAEDEQAMRRNQDGPDIIAARWQVLGCPEVVVKQGPAGPLVAAAPEPPIVLECQPIVMVDSSGAGDAFNAGYLRARLSGASPAEAACCGHDLAGWVITRHGALPRQTADAPYHSLSDKELRR